MATYGNTATPSGGYTYADFGNQMLWTDFTFPSGSGGTLTDVWIYAAGDGSSVTANIGLYDGGSGLQYQSGTFTMPSGSRSNGGQTWNHGSGCSYVVGGGGQLKLALWSSGNIVWTYENSSNDHSNIRQTQYETGLGSIPGTLRGKGNLGSGGLGAYVVYGGGGGGGGGGGMHVRRDEGWNTAAVKVRRSGTWTTAVVKVRRSGHWVTTT
jgi:hypothetical protein